MSASTAPPLPSVSPAEMQTLISRAGLSLNPGQMADLVLAWRQVAGLLALIPRDRPMADDQAYVFRLPPPAAAVEAHPAPKPAAKAPQAPKAVKPAPKTKPARKVARLATHKAARKPARPQAAKRPAKKAAARKPARRRR